MIGSSTTSSSCSWVVAETERRVDERMRVRYMSEKHCVFGVGLAMVISEEDTSQLSFTPQSSRLSFHAP